MCAPNIFRSSFSNWQPGYAMGEVVAKKGHKKVVTITWKYAAGDERCGASRRPSRRAAARW
jgi:branched-chain amino acid transport system substrate-binding protein